MRILLAAFYTPGVRAIEYLIANGLRPGDVRLLTYKLERNQALLAFAAAHGIETRTFSVKSKEAYEWIKEFEPDFVFSLYSREIMPQAVLDLVRVAALNLHPSLLPKYKGMFSAPWVIINGEDHTGFTYHYMVAEIDAGNIVLQETVPVADDDTAYSLYHRLIVAGMSAFPEAFRLVTKDRHPGSPQEGEGTWYPRKVPHGGYIDPAWSREQIGRFIRAMYFPPFKGACVRLEGGEEREVLSMAEYDALIASGAVVVRGAT